MPMFKIPKNLRAYIVIAIVIALCIGLTILLNNTNFLQIISEKGTHRQNDNVLIKRDLAKNPTDIIKDSYNMGQSAYVENNEYRPMDLNELNGYSPFMKQNLMI